MSTDEKQVSGSPDHTPTPTLKEAPAPEARTLEQVNAEYSATASALGDFMCRATVFQEEAVKLQHRLVALVREGDSLRIAKLSAAKTPEASA